MDKENTPVSSFYDSDEDYSWGPVTLREIKRNLRTRNKLDPKTFRRQTAAFIPLPVEDNSRMYTANSTQSSKDYFTANESLESNLKTTEKDNPQNSSLNKSNRNTEIFSSMYTDPVESSEVVSISSDSEDDIKSPASISVKRERITGNLITEENYSKTNEEYLDGDVIYLSSSHEESDLENSLNTSDQGVTPANLLESGNKGELSINELTTEESTAHLNESFSERENACMKDHVLNYFSSNYPIDQDFSLNYKGDSVAENNINISPEVSSTEKCFESMQECCHDQELDEISNKSFSLSKQNIHVSSSSTDQAVNISQKENEYSYCVDKNGTLPQLKADCSHYSESSQNSHETDKANDVPMSSKNDTNISSQDVYPTNSMCEDLGNVSLNDTFSEMQKLISQGYYSDSDDSSDNIIESTPRKELSLSKETLTSSNYSRIPVPTHSNEGSLNYSSLSSDFKVPKFPPKSTKKMQGGNKFFVPKTSPSPLKDIISPVRLYIKNSPFAALKQNYKAGCSRSQITFRDKSENYTVSHKTNKNIRDSLPEIVYKPSKIVEKKEEKKIILPKNIISLISDRTVIKHETRRRINLDESVFTVGDKLEMQDLSHVVSDENNVSVYTIKQGLNL